MWPFKREKTETITIKRPGREEETVPIFMKNGAQFVKIDDFVGQPFEIEVRYLYEMDIVKSRSRDIEDGPAAKSLVEKTHMESPVDRSQDMLRLLSRAVTDVARFAMQDGHGVVEATCSDVAFKIIGVHAQADKAKQEDVDKIVMEIFASLIAAAAPLNGNSDYTDTVANTFASTFVRHMPETNWTEISKQHVKDATTDMIRQFGRP